MISSLRQFYFPIRLGAGRIGRRIFSRVAILGLLCLFSACTYIAPSYAPIANQPESKDFDAQASVVMKAVLRVLAEKRFKINSAKTDGQRLETEWLQDGSYRSMVLADVLALDKYRSKLTVNLLLQKKAFLKESWEPMDKIDKTVYSDFMNDVLIECYRVLYERR